jgi:ATP-binding cassette subfamily B (MDR/TAP) protein 1
MSGATLGTILGAGAAIIVAIIVGLVFGWKLALVCISTMPLLLGCGYFRFHVRFPDLLNLTSSTF